MIRVTLAAAIIAALASITAAWMAIEASYVVEEIRAREARQNATLEFRRDQIRNLTTLAFESSIRLHAKFYSLWKVSVISDVSIVELEQTATDNIANITYAYAALLEMDAVPPDRKADVQSVTDSIWLDWKSFSSAISEYKEAMAR